MRLISPKFIPQIQSNKRLQIATLGAGCFWGPEHLFLKHFGDKGLVDTEVGYSGGSIENPTYEQVSSSKTEYVECVQLLFDPDLLTYEQILDFFFRMHDPTQLNRQGPDVGTQYRSVIYSMNESQLKIAFELKEKFQQTFWKDPIQTKIEKIINWWDAETYHQHYLEHNPLGYECPTHYVRTVSQYSEDVGEPSNSAEVSVRV